MAKIETLGSQGLNNQNTQLERRPTDNGLSVVKIETPANPKEKPKSKKENKDYVITLDIGDKNRDFRDKQSKLANFWENTKAILSSAKEKLPESRTGTAKIFDLEQRAQASATENEEAAEVIIQQRNELLAIEQQIQNAESEAQSPEPEQEIHEPSAEVATDTKTATENNEADIFYEMPSALKMQMKLVGDMIRRAGPKVEGGYNDIVEGLESGNLEFSKKEKTANTINTLLKEHDWRGENLTNLKAVLKSLEDDIGARKYDLEQASKQQGMGEILEGYAENESKKQAYEKFNALIKKFYGTRGEHAQFADQFSGSNSRDKKTLRIGMNAVRGLRRKSGKLAEDELLLLNEVEKFIRHEQK